MSKSLLIFKGCDKFFIVAVFSLVFIFSVVNHASANDWTFIDDFESHNPGDLNGQGGWAVTNRYGNSNNSVNISTENPAEGTKDVEINNNDSLIVTRNITPIRTGIFQFRMRHNKSGLFYFNALTSDMGGQLLFSIQFTQSKGILLEEATEQITLLPDYNINQWYLFTVDFNNEKGTFKIKIDDGDYGEYKYVNSESTLFDFAQMVFGSESGTAISAFGDIKPALPSSITVTKKVIPDTSTKTTGILPEIVHGVLNFLGINTTTTSTTTSADATTTVLTSPADMTATSTETPSTDIASSTITIVDITPTSASLEEATTTSDIITLTEEATTTQTALENSSLAAAVGVLNLNLNVDVLFIVILIVDTLLLAFLYRYIMRWYRAKKEYEDAYREL
ncbi:MAG: hypothetical protein NTY93_01325 [Candidatus Kaiserbacteria bacterium]|nr:hypothetical protein [Candidatus Kaiserbacteria bacterium]